MITMKPERNSVIEGLDMQAMSRDDMDAMSAPVLRTSEEPSGRDDLEIHFRRHLHDHAHVDLLQAEYIPEEVARMIGTSLEVVMHAIWSGDLKAERKGRDVICIPNTELTAWLAKR